MIVAREPIALIRGLSHRYGSVVALQDVSLDVPARRLVGVIGPDGIGKSSLLSSVAGARRVQTGEVEVAGANMRKARARRAACAHIAYMPQGLGRNLYPDLSVRENVEFFARLFGQNRAERGSRIDSLLRGTGLAPFADRAARKLSGGMRQKLGLCCALVHDPDLLILDEPTTGVDPLSRRRFWDLIAGMRRRRPDLSVLVATAYMEEAEHFDHLIVMNAGQVLATGAPLELKTRLGKGSIEECFIALLPEPLRRLRPTVHVPPPTADGKPPAVLARDLTKRFGDFAAVDRVSFTIGQGEIFGFVGSNGCGKTTTMKMLTGLLPATSGEARIFGQKVDPRDVRVRARVGYMSQSFSLYTELTVAQNLRLHARLFHLPAAVAEPRIRMLTARFGLEQHADQLAVDLPVGIRQRLSLAVAVVHQPDLLILDEPTSGVDPLARDVFWALLIDLSRHEGVTIFVSTHFMNEAARCDRVALMHEGRVLAVGPPADLIRQRDASTLDDAFVSFLEAETPETTPEAPDLIYGPAKPSSTQRERQRWSSFSLRRLRAYARRESLELRRDRVRLVFALLGTAFLMIVFGYGITTDVDRVTFAALDRDQTPESRAYVEEFRGSRYFVEKGDLSDYADLDRQLKRGSISLGIEVPPGFGKTLRRGDQAEIGAWIDGAMPFHAETIRGYLQAAHQSFVSQLAAHSGRPPPAPAADIETRFRYNQDFKSIYAMVPSTMSMLLALIPAILMSLAVVREKELGSITNLYVTPVTRLEFLIGKQLPYIAISMFNFLCLSAMAIFLFRVPMKGSVTALCLGALLYVTATTGYGMFISAFPRTQIAALFGTAIVTVLPATQFSGMLIPVSSLTGAPAAMGKLFPMTYFLPVCVGTFTKALDLRDLWTSLLALALFIPALTLLSILFLRKQEA